MADEQNELRRVNWNEIFSFSHIFKSFRMAIHPSKLLLGLATVACVFVGGWMLDGLWTLGDEYVQEGEIASHYALSSERFADSKENWQRTRPDQIADLHGRTVREGYSLNSYKSKLPATVRGGYFARAFDEILTVDNESRKFQAPNNEVRTKFLDDARDDWDDSLDDIESEFGEEVSRIESYIEKAYDKAEDEVEKLSSEDEDQAEEKLQKDYKLAWQALTRRKIEFAKKVQAIRGRKVFSSLMDYELACVSKAISAVWKGRIFTGLSDYIDTMRARSAPPQMAVSVTTMVPPTAEAEPQGFLFWILIAVHGIFWLICEHWLYALIFLLFALAVWAFFGGAISRIAALHAAREEKISILQAIKFSAGKFPNFFTAPLIPLALILFIGGLTVLGSFALGNWPYIGEIFLGLSILLPLIAGLVIAFLTVGLVAGAGLMYPTIAVEGSDSFDAISRSFSYVFSRPWRAVVYGLISLVYGVLTYLFVRLFAFVALSASHMFVRWGIFTGGAKLSPSADKLDLIWTRPTFDSLFGPFQWEAMNGTEKIGAFLIGIWVFIIAGLVVAYLLSYFASSATIIYYLLRRKVDATDLDDVYVEEAEELEMSAELDQTVEEPASQEAVETAEEEKPTKEKSSTPKKPKAKPAEDEESG